jgi:hypothetical protein
MFIICSDLPGRESRSGLGYAHPSVGDGVDNLRAGDYTFLREAF